MRALRSSSSPWRASAGTTLARPASPRLLLRVAWQARRAAPRGGGRAQSRAPRDLQEGRGTRTRRCRRRNAPAPGRTAPAARGAGRHAVRRRARDGDEAIEVRCRSGAGVVVDPVAAAQEAGHHGLGHARGERRRDRCVGGASALRQNLGTRSGGGGMACGHCLHPESFASSLPFRLVRGGWRIALLSAGIAAAVVLFLVVRGENQDEEPQPPPPTATQPKATTTVETQPKPPAPLIVRINSRAPGSDAHQRPPRASGRAPRHRRAGRRDSSSRL